MQANTEKPEARKFEDSDDNEDLMVPGARKYRKSSEETEILLESDSEDRKDNGAEHQRQPDGDSSAPRKPLPIYPLNFGSPSPAEGMLGFSGSEAGRSTESAPPVGFPLPQYPAPLPGYPVIPGSSSSVMGMPPSTDSMDSFLNSTAFYSGKNQSNSSDHGDFIPHFVFTPRHPMGKKYFRCPQCRYYTDRKNNLKRHIGTMHQDCGKVLECCEIMFRSKAALRDHIMLFHRTGYRCKHCGRNFCRKALLKRHLAVHGGQKEYYCDTCDYATSQRASFDRHTRNHTLKSSFGRDDDEALETKLGVLQASQQDQLNFWYLASGYMPESIFPYQRAGSLFGGGQAGLPLPDRQRLPQPSGRDQASSPGINLARPARADGQKSPVDKTPEEDPDKKIKITDDVIEKEDRGFVPFRDLALLNGHLSPFNKRLFDRPYKCNDCASTFSNQQLFRDHVKQCKRPDFTEPPTPLQLLAKSQLKIEEENDDKPLCLVKNETKKKESLKLSETSSKNVAVSSDAGDKKIRGEPKVEKGAYFGAPFPALYKPLDLSSVIRPEPFFPFPPFGWLGGSNPLTHPRIFPWSTAPPGKEGPTASQGAAPLSPPASSPSPRGSPVGGNDTDGSQGTPGETGSSLPFKKRLLHS